VDAHRQTVDEAGSASRSSVQPAILDVTLNETQLITRLRSGDEAAFLQVVGEHHQALLRVSRAYVSNQAVAEEVVQETWLGVLRGIGRFEGRCSLKTWIFQILINRAITRSQREARTVSFSALAGSEMEQSQPLVDPSRLAGPNAEYPDRWAVAPQEWAMTPEQLLLSNECRTHIERAIAALPPVQRQVITMRDIQGWTNEEICNTLGISESNCRVLLHRARSRVRQVMEDYLGEN
jgi:RNA polymerase sigma-70 factor (ECF subfamily)